MILTNLGLVLGPLLLLVQRVPGVCEVDSHFFLKDSHLSHRPQVLVYEVDSHFSLKDSHLSHRPQVLVYEVDSHFSLKDSHLTLLAIKQARTLPRQVILTTAIQLATCPRTGSSPPTPCQWKSVFCNVLTMGRERVSFQRSWVFLLAQFLYGSNPLLVLRSLLSVTKVLLILPARGSVSQPTPTSRKPFSSGLLRSP